MIWQNISLTLPDGTTMTCRDTVTRLTTGIVFYFENPSSDSDTKKIQEMAELFSRKFLAIVRIEWPESLIREDSLSEKKLSPDQAISDDVFSGCPVNKKNAALVQSMIETLKEYYHRFKPWYLCYADGYVARLVYSCFREYGAVALAYSLVNTGWDEKIKDTGTYCYNMIMINLDRVIDCDYEGILYPRADGVWDFILSAFTKAKKQFWKDWFDVLNNNYFENNEPSSKQHEMMLNLAMDGCPEAAFSLYEFYKNLKKSGEMPSGEEQHFLEMLDSAAAILASEWQQVWPTELFWAVAAARFGHTGARVILWGYLASTALTPEQRDTLIRNLEMESEAGYSYASILLGLRFEPFYQSLVGKPDPAKAAAFYKRAAEQADPEGDYRSGRIIEYGFKVGKKLADIDSYDLSSGFSDPCSILTETDPMFYYKKAADAGYLPAMIRLVSFLETVSENERDLSHIESLYDEITSIDRIGWCYARLGLCREALGDVEGAAVAYEDALYYNPDEVDESVVKNWSYTDGIDWFYDSILPNDDILMTGYPYFPRAEKPLNSLINLRLGILLMSDSELSSYTTTVQCFENIVEDVLYEYEKKQDVSISVTADPVISEALYYYGLCCLKGNQCSRNIKKGWICMEISALSGNEKAAEYDSFRREAEQFLKEAEKSSIKQKHGGVDSSGSDTEPFARAAMRRREAAFRLRWLSMMGLPESIVTDFQKERILYVAESDYDELRPFPDDDPDDYQKLILKEISRMERMHKATVYLVNISHGFGAVYISLFYVSYDVSEWEWDREQLMNFEPFVYAFDVDLMNENYLPEIGRIGITIEDENIIRDW